MADAKRESSMARCWWETVNFATPPSKTETIPVKMTVAESVWPRLVWRRGSVLRRFTSMTVPPGKHRDVDQSDSWLSATRGACGLCRNTVHVKHLAHQV